MKRARDTPDCTSVSFFFSFCVFPKSYSLLLSDERRELGSVEAIEKLHNILYKYNLVRRNVCGMSNHSSIKTLFCFVSLVFPVFPL